MPLILSLMLNVMTLRNNTASDLLVCMEPLIRRQRVISGKVCSVTFLLLPFPGFVEGILMTISGIGRSRVC